MDDLNWRTSSGRFELFLGEEDLCAVVTSSSEEFLATYYPPNVKKPVVHVNTPSLAEAKAWAVAMVRMNG